MKSCYETRRRCRLFLSATQRTANGEAQFSCCSVKLHLFYSCFPQQPSVDYSRTFMELCGIVNVRCK